MSKRMPLPLQPVELDEHGTTRFVPNRIVRFLLDEGPFDLNHLASMPGRFTKAEQAQFASLIGYSVSGFADLSYVSDTYYNKAARAGERLRKAKQGND